MVTKSFGKCIDAYSMHDMLSIPWNKITLCYIVLSILPGAYEHCVCFTSRANGTPAAQSRDEFATNEEEKDLEEDSANFTIAMCH